MENILISQREKKRESNIELLRILSMVYVLVGHSSYVSLGAPTQEELLMSFCSSGMRCLVESFSSVGVNTFILISGWFGINSRINRFVEFIFQILFLEVTLYVIMRLLGLTNTMNTSDWVDLLFFKYGSYWFIKAYIVLYIFAPILNAFVNHCGRLKLKWFLISFFVFQSIWGFYINTGWFSSGYSPLSFMGLYLLARYMRLYPNKYTKLSRYTDVALYVIISFVIAICSLSMVYFFNKVGTFVFQYSSPLLVLSSVYLFLAFSKMSLNSSFINWISISCFAIYVVHCSPFVFYPYYIDYIKYWFVKESNISFVFYVILFLSFYFMFSIFIDKIRIVFWRVLGWILMLCRRCGFSKSILW